MLTCCHLIKFKKASDWFVTIDLKDAYFHIPIQSSQQKCMWFAFKGIAYHFLLSYVRPGPGTKVCGGSYHPARTTGCASVLPG